MRSLSASQTAPQLAGLRPLAAAIANRDVAPAEIVWWGDSVSEGSTLTDSKHSMMYRFQEMLRGAFPTAGVRGGRGYIPVYYESASIPDEWTIDLTANLGGASTAVNEINSGLGARGKQLAHGAAVEITQEFTDFDVHYSKNAFGVPFNVFVDGIQQGGSIATNAGTITGGFIQSYTGFAPGEHTVRIATTDTTGFISVIHGATFFFGDKNKGIHVYDAAKSGASAAAPTFGVEHFRHLTTIQPACVVVQLLTNDAVFFSSPSTYRTNLESVLTNIASAMSGIPHTLIGLSVAEPDGTFVGGALWPEYTRHMQQAIEAYPNGVFANMADFQGPTVDGDTLGLWGDSVHLSRKGAQHAADRLLWELCLNGGGTTVPVSNAYQTLPFFKAGTLAVGSGKFPIYNDTGGVWTFTAARAEVGTAPTGAGIVVQVKINGSNAFTVTIASGATTGSNLSPPTVQVPIGGKVTCDITQVGSTVPGADLSVTLTTQSIV